LIGKKVKNQSRTSVFNDAKSKILTNSLTTGGDSRSLSKFQFFLNFLERKKALFREKRKKNSFM